MWGCTTPLTGSTGGSSKGGGDLALGGPSDPSVLVSLIIKFCLKQSLVTPRTAHWEGVWEGLHTDSEGDISESSADLINQTDTGHIEYRQSGRFD